MNGIVVCDAARGLAHLPTRDVSVWLENADGKVHPMVRVPAQPKDVEKVPTDASARIAYQRTCTRYMRRYLPATIARNGDDPDTAAAEVFDGMEECDAVAGFATISRAELARIIKAKHLE